MRLNICDYNDWDKFLESLKGKGKWTQLRAVNARMNKAKYISDKANWGRKDYWATPGEFMSRFGDCEDYAIVKWTPRKTSPLSPVSDSLREMAMGERNEGSTWVFRS